jgi:hypothetical protein
MSSRKTRRARRPRSRKPRAAQSDSVHFKGSDILANISYVNAGTGPILIGSSSSYSVDLRPGVLSDRVKVEASIFSRWRINWLKITYKSFAPSSIYGSLAMGILDDAVTFDANSTYNTFDSVVNLRRSADSNLWKSFALTWKPLDPLKWYYTDNNPSGDLRFSSPCSLYAAFSTPVTNYTANNYGSIRVDYSITFSGATPTVSISKLLQLKPERVPAEEEAATSSSQPSKAEKSKGCDCTH